ncbi:SepM family pheromone-processing serine protease [Lederbergia wuyishanensis]|uniref:endopeptidase La n=1 Tax=Lederbergia wuyishanensis TaxID=1347903 RepID=A0ABU0D3U2_9BACI|nr:SepM family pheromone-processing serine protease [Lederbergia wuyishanensis]MCJ8007767.1 PDZ domain-containing protein [Lederbergia wuyishanensis]MDQ0343070.1 PDZ domain-containing protein [Lederbergia wuyishanensis]
MAILKQRKNKVFAVICLLLVITFFIPTPYYLFQPGSVEELGSKVTVEGGDKTSKGNLYLTTVLSLRASNIYYLAYGMVAPHTDLRKVKEVRGDMTDEEYSKILEHMMTTSQQHALVAGLRAAGEKVNVQPNGIFVTTILDTSTAKGKLKVGDIITQVDDQPVSKSTDFLDYLSKKKVGDTVKLMFNRDSTVKTANVELIPITNSPNRAGVGIGPEDQFKVETDRTVKINAEDIGGPSAGLMFSLEVYNQLTAGDVTKGYEIAGTGTIDMDGNVGQIGGIREKITAVHKAGMDIFFCPADILDNDTNEKDVKDEVQKEGYKVKIVPVKTIQEAIDYLDKIPPKEGK